MTFRRFLGACSVITCLVAGGLRTFTLLTATDPAAGVPHTGPLWLHYLLLAAPVVLMLLFSLAVPVGTCHRFGSAAGIPAFCGLLFSGAMGVCLFVLGRTQPSVLVAAVLMALGSLWFAGYILRGSSTAPFCGITAALGWLLVCVLLFSGKAASLYHINHVLELLSSAGILLFLCGVLRAAYSDGIPGISRMLFFRGMLAFYLGFCLLLPQELWLWKQGQPVLFFQGKCVGAALLGISGLIWALHCMCSPGEPAREEPETDPAAVFAEAERRLREESAALPRTEADTSAAPQPQRWSSAASALYGTAAPKTEEPAAKTDVPGVPPVTEPAAAECAETPAPVAKTPAEPEPAPVFEPQSAAIPKAEAPAASFPAEWRPGHRARGAAAHPCTMPGALGAGQRARGTAAQPCTMPRALGAGTQAAGALTSPHPASLSTGPRAACSAVTLGDSCSRESWVRDTACVQNTHRCQAPSQKRAPAD